jgi:hypothetical protein
MAQGRSQRKPAPAVKPLSTSEMETWQALSTQAKFSRAFRRDDAEVEEPEHPDAWRG